MNQIIRRNIFNILLLINKKFNDIISNNIEYDKDSAKIKIKNINKDKILFITNIISTHGLEIKLFIHDNIYYKDIDDIIELNGDIYLILEQKEIIKNQKFGNLIESFKMFIKQHNLENIEELNFNHESDLTKLKLGDRVVAYFTEPDSNLVDYEKIGVATVYINHERIFLIQNKFAGNTPDYYSLYKLNDWRRFGDRSWVISNTHISGININSKDFYIYGKIK